MKFKTLQNITENIRYDIFRCEEAIYLLEYIGLRSEEINEKYGILFGRIQYILEEQIINLLSIIFEKPKDYPLNSLPELRKHLKNIEEDLKEYEKNSGDNFINSTSKKLLNEIGINAIPEKKLLSGLIIKKIDNHFGNSKELRNRLNKWRSKVYAHHERINDTKITLENIFIEEKKQLLNDAKLYLCIVENIYLEMVTVDYEAENYLPIEDSKRAVSILRNLLVDANLLKRNEERIIINSLFKN